MILLEVTDGICLRFSEKEEKAMKVIAAGLIIKTAFNNQGWAGPCKNPLNDYRCFKCLEGGLYINKGIITSYREYAFDYPDPSLNADQGISSGSGRVSITSNTTYEIQHYSQNSQSSYGFGTAMNIGFDEQYATVTIWKVA